MRRDGWWVEAGRCSEVGHLTGGAAPLVRLVEERTMLWVIRSLRLQMRGPWWRRHRGSPRRAEAVLRSACSGLPFEVMPRPRQRRSAPTLGRGPAAVAATAADPGALVRSGRPRPPLIPATVPGMSDWFDRNRRSISFEGEPPSAGAEPGQRTRRGPGRRPATGRPPWTGPGRGSCRLEVMISARSRSCAPLHVARPGRRRGVVRRPGRWPAEAHAEDSCSTRSSSAAGSGSACGVAETTARSTART